MSEVFTESDKGAKLHDDTVLSFALRASSNEKVRRARSPVSMRPKSRFFATAAVLVTAFVLWIQTPAPDSQVAGGATPASPPYTDVTERRTEPDLKGSERK